MINIIIALAGTAVCAYSDIKTGYLPELLIYCMVAFGALFVLLAFPLEQAVMVYIMAGLVFGVGFLAYIFGQVGGGDVFLFTALTLLIPFYPAELIPLMGGFGINSAVAFYPFILSVFILSGILYMLVIPVIYISKIRKIKGKIKDYNSKIRSGLLYSVLFMPFFLLWLFYFTPFILLIIPLVLTAMVIPFKDDIIKYFFAQKKKVSDLDDDDVLALELISKSTRSKLGLWRKTFTNHELKGIKQRAKKLGIKEVIVCENMPKYVPYIFVSLVLNLIFGDALLFMALGMT